MKAEKTRLKLIFGSMFGGKTTELMRLLRIRRFYQNVCAVSHNRDIRYSDSGLVTHDHFSMKCVRVENLEDLRLMPEYAEAETIGIDEGGFFTNLYDFIIEELKTTTKSFIITSLAGDFKKRLFGEAYRLIPEADDGILFLATVCKKCKDGTPACFNRMKQKDASQDGILVGSDDVYEALCRAHFDEMEKSDSPD